MRAAFLSVWAVLLSVGFLQVANGLQTDIIGVRADQEAFSASTIGLMMATYYVGYSLAPLAARFVISRIGHVSTIVACALVAAVVILAHPFLVTPPLWAGYRFISGFALSLVYVAYESWINERVPNVLRGRVFSSYMVVQMVTMTLAQGLLDLGNPKNAGLFVLCSIVFALAAIPVSAARHLAPVNAPPAPLGLVKLFHISPLAAAATTFAGVSWAIIFTFGPIYAQHAGFDLAHIGLFMGVAMAAGGLLQFPLGWLSDIAGRRPVIVLILVTGLCASLFGVWATRQGLGANLAAAALVGGFTFPLYGVAVAHVNDAIASETRVAAASGLVLLFGIGSIFGPLLCGWATTVIGPAGYFTMLATTMAVGALIALRYR
ncbi:MAG: MFS transporter [Alphaproteobacteria bacterium]|nr:MFS transporter [Alphaproteobacteria bacterium]